ncbi:Isoprenylcysteine carboxyl methyltransferase (ICMT) family protein [Posidoniimonas corsicana]|uniref:Isoprenylcysteine carboxyl methyltransferase (ICMT) family protein n=1 Tax=Posidoniimonas corsicana TaxID=1938618 RepID=A0A5C5VED8_9BACT|nr:isoprenylcysteine carboxylmethyltransferase family protein [Posidoniimonas corsicana]TWT36327.1 Isoprenylcysteine carboxyl methyltransferase (ICMT) family protein [Posidoniimonas corsicana]
MRTESPEVGGHRYFWAGSLLQCAVAVWLVAAVSRREELRYLAPYLAVMMGFTLFDRVLRRHHPSVLRELMRPGVSLTDKLTFVGGGLLLTTHFVVGVADASYFHWSGVTPSWVRVVGLAVMIAGFGLAAWAMLLNPFFSPVVRVQRERRHRVITAGPYRWVRHPSYLGLSVGAVASAFALGSYWSLIPALAFVALYARRAQFEDRVLSEELAGFSRYATRVRYRLAPGLW